MIVLLLTQGSGFSEELFPSPATTEAEVASDQTPQAASQKKTAVGPSFWDVTDLLSPKSARQAFQNLSEKGKSSIPAIRTMLAGKNLRLIRAALDLAEKIDDPGQGLHKELTRIVSSRQLGRLRLRAMRVLGSYGQAARKALPAISRMLYDSNPELRLGAAEAFLNVLSQGPRSFHGLFRLLRTPNHPIRKAAIQLLQSAGSLVHPIAPVLIDFLETGSVRPIKVISFLLPSGSLLHNLIEPLTGDESAASPDPDAEAVQTEEGLEGIVASEAEVAEADAADTALSFEDVPAHEP